MCRILIACGDEIYTNGLRELLQGKFEVETCNSGKWAIELLSSFSPDIVVLDNGLAEYDCLAVMQAIRLSGKPIHIILITNILTPVLEKQLTELRVGMVLVKPCSMTAILGHVLFASEVLEGNDYPLDEQRVLDNLLMEIGFKIGLQRYDLVKSAVLASYKADSNIQMKQLYIEVAAENNTTVLSVEKSMRDAIKAARADGDPCLWNLLFARCPGEACGKIGNEEFSSRIALFLKERSRLKPAYKNFSEKIL